LFKKKTKPNFARAGDRAVEALFHVFSRLNRVVSVLPSPGQDLIY
jgi:hypothetical protein